MNKKDILISVLKPFDAVRVISTCWLLYMAYFETQTIINRLNNMHSELSNDLMSKIVSR